MGNLEKYKQHQIFSDILFQAITQVLKAITTLQLQPIIMVFLHLFYYLFSHPLHL